MNVYFVTTFTLIAILVTLMVATFRPDALVKTAGSFMTLVAVATFSHLVWPGQPAGYVVFGFCLIAIAATMAYDHRQQERERNAGRVPRDQIAGEYCVLVRDYDGASVDVE